ncbi:hypothetical protein Rsub_10577 [Raphidocelis subcapitata]|uniref:Uncharacterized protein n=1 Tax=Raphidocelis subcapitata TaxID=307507 RepID=A0A2V0PM84_9CHLO|nr:hypothetical protein Rsub_10577 [Raphidocelis subcapitata]|eukprot:GBF98165.1 hypothetical protein Rsub_10577 [Raphidocelis subcapitata]
MLGGNRPLFIKVVAALAAAGACAALLAPASGPPPPASVLDALDAEARVTAATYWGIEPRREEQRREQGPGRADVGRS